MAADRRTLPLLGVAGLAALVFLYQLGSSSFFVDEALTMKSADGPLSELWDSVKLDENNPPAYYFLLHLWLDLVGSDAEWAARLPSALACVALVPVVHRLGTIAGGERAGMVAAALAALSPLLLVYAQQARVYALAMLACALAVLGGLEAAERTGASEGRGSRRWLGIGAVAAAAAVSLHYFTLMVVGPLCLWVLTRRALPPRRRLAFCAVPAAAWLAWLPLALEQASDDRQAELGEFGTLTRGHAVRVLGAPFEDRYTVDIGALKALAAAVMAGSLAYVLARAWRDRRAALLLLAGLPLVSATALALAAAADRELFHSRYMTFVAPLMLAVLGAALVRAPRAVALPALAIAAVAAVAGVVGSQRDSGFYPDARGVADAIAEERAPGDVVLHHATLSTWYPVEYYVRRRVPATPVHSLFDPEAEALLRARRRAWIVRDEKTDTARAPFPVGYRVGARRRFDAAGDLTLLLAVPN